MKIITNKKAKHISKDLAKNFKVALSAHGVKPKEAVILQLENSIYKMLGGKVKRNFTIFFPHLNNIKKGKK